MDTDNLYDEIETAQSDTTEVKAEIKSESESPAESDGEIEFADWRIKTEEVDVSDMENDIEPVRKIEMNSPEKKATGNRQPTRLRSSTAQMELMLKFMEDHHALAKGLLFGADGAQKSAELWERLTSLLNSCGVGPAKECAKWQKSWIDWKSGVKTKAARNALHLQRYGIGSHWKRLSHIEQRVHNIMTAVSVKSKETISEAGCSRSDDRECNSCKVDIDDSISAEQLPPTASKPLDKMNVDVSEVRKVLKRPRPPTDNNTRVEGEKQGKLDDERLAIERARLDLEKERFQFEKTVEEKKLEIKLEKLNLMKMYHEKYCLLIDDIKDIKSALVSFLNE